MIHKQYFCAGDKVMEVIGNDEIVKSFPHLAYCEDANTRPGVVYCVERFQESSPCNSVWLVGVDCGEWGLVAEHFRRVEEIRLCVQAVKKISEPQKELQP